jgi:hypothetical protein
MFRKVSILLLFVLFTNSCSLIYDQSKQDDAKNNDKDSGISIKIYQENKNYESNRILSSDFPVTYRAKPLKTF